MPGLGHWWVLLILAAIALIVFGPSRLPELGAGLGKAIREFRKATTDMGDALKDEAHKPSESTPTAVGTTYTPPPAGTVDPAAPPAPTATPATTATPASTATPTPTAPPEAPKA
jgi:TatA/E family protein of Tat protein translocase